MCRKRFAHLLTSSIYTPTDSLGFTMALRACSYVRPSSQTHLGRMDVLRILCSTCSNPQKILHGSFLAGPPCAPLREGRTAGRTDGPRHTPWRYPNSGGLVGPLEATADAHASLCPLIRPQTDGLKGAGPALFILFFAGVWQVRGNSGLGWWQGSSEKKGMWADIHITVSWG